MKYEEIKRRYFDWMCSLVSGKLYQKLLALLYETPFVWLHPMDENRASDGINLRYIFGKECGYPHAKIAATLDCEDCSVLEMMLALALRCEESIMDNPEFGNRTKEWFWDMVRCLGLDGMTDATFESAAAKQIIRRFLDRKYAANGKGGLFILKHPRRDLRNVEIWYQAMWHFDEVLRG